ncbi:MAG: hypothetical protein H6Q89_2072 [Myxococcaceae bacterium]|nr:hypothetical protein [Myxococcaceae bacterium]
MRLISLTLLLASPALAGGSVEGTLTVKNDGQPGFVKNSLLFIRGYATEPTSEPATMAQSGRAFDKVVLPVVKKGKVRFANEELLESIYHHVFTPSTKVKFSSPKYKPKDPPYITDPLTYEGPMTVFCDIHKEMISTVYVVPNDRHTVLSTAEGASAPFRIDGIRPGNWTLVAWHRSAKEPVEVPVEIKEGQTTRINLTLDGASQIEKVLLDHKRKSGKYGVKPDGGSMGEAVGEDEKWK